MVARSASEFSVSRSNPQRFKAARVPNSDGLVSSVILPLICWRTETGCCVLAGVVCADTRPAVTRMRAENLEKRAPRRASSNEATHGAFFQCTRARNAPATRLLALHVDVGE